MKAVGLTQYLPTDNENSLLDVEIPKPTAKGKDLLVQVKAISVNPVDYKVRSPQDKVESEPRILGWDAAGIVVEVGEEVTEFRPGDEVYYAGDITRPGSNSEFHLVDTRIVGRKPKNLDFANAAAFPLTGITAWEALFERLNIDNIQCSKYFSLKRNCVNTDLHLFLIWLFFFMLSVLIEKQILICSKRC